MILVTVKVRNCNECPYSSSRSQQVGLSTGDYYMLNWRCEKLDEKIAFVDFDEKVEIPNNCPFLKKQ